MSNLRAILYFKVMCEVIERIVNGDKWLLENENDRNTSFFKELKTIDSFPWNHPAKRN